jgi:hypothetical protein
MDGWMDGWTGSHRWEFGRAETHKTCLTQKHFSMARESVLNTEL